MTADEQTAALTRELFGKVGALLESELQKGGEDFTLLEQMNLVTTAKYRCATPSTKNSASFAAGRDTAPRGIAITRRTQPAVST